MVLWLILFLLVIAISFILAFLSMRDYQEIPHHSKVEYGLFLIRNIEGLNVQTLDLLRHRLQKDGLIVSIERLFKGKQAALTIFGPKNILDQFKEQLNLLELEDYTLDLNHEETAIWEVGVKNNQLPAGVENIFNNLPKMHSEDQFLWQIILSPKGEKDLSFQTQIRAAVFSKDHVRRKTITPILQNLHVDKLVKIPRPFTPEQMVEFYKLRSLSLDTKGPVLGPEDVLRLLRI